MEKLSLDIRKNIANIIKKYGIERNCSEIYVEYGNKYWILWANKFLMFSEKSDNFNVFQAISELDIDEINDFINNFE